MSLMEARNPWEQVLEQLRQSLDGEEFRRWFSQCSFAFDSGDHITVWVPTEPARRHIVANYADHLERALAAMDRSRSYIRFVVSGYAEDEDDDEG